MPVYSFYALTGNRI